MKRTIDVPVFHTKPVIFTFQQAITVNMAGNYVWPLTRVPFTPNLALSPRTLYLVRTLTFSANIGEADYQGAIVTMPHFNIYVEQSGFIPDFRAPVPLPMYFQNLAYEYSVFYRGGSDNLNNTEENFYGTFEGTLVQTANLVGKQSVTLTVLLTVQEIEDNDFIRNR
jgi:hypothetical protein